MYCWSYMNSDQYIVKSGYLVTRNILNHETEVVQLEPSITKLQTFVWKINAPLNMQNFICQMVTDHVAITKNLARCHI